MADSEVTAAVLSTPVKPSTVWSREFWEGAGERALKTAAQTLLAGLVITVPFTHQPWIPALGLAGTATVFSLLTSLGNADFTAGLGTRRHPKHVLR